MRRRPFQKLEGENLEAERRRASWEGLGVGRTAETEVG